MIGGEVYESMMMVARLRLVEMVMPTVMAITIIIPGLTEFQPKRITIVIGGTKKKSSKLNFPTNNLNIFIKYFGTKGVCTRWTASGAQKHWVSSSSSRMKIMWKGCKETIVSSNFEFRTMHYGKVVA